MTVPPEPSPATERPPRTGGSHPSWLQPHDLENVAPVVAFLVLAIGLQYLLPDTYVLLRPHWLLPLIEALLLIALVALSSRPGARLHRVGLLLIALMSLDNAVSSALLDAGLLTGSVGSDALPLLASGASIYATNIIAFGLWYWQLDRGGPSARAVVRHPYPDFLFPQMGQTSLAPPTWRPIFLDYLYVSFTNATAFSPTDVMPLTDAPK